jgi:aerobic-type carbon monoxide dehydrogenase small subunit (CoxS/CutS family)
MTAPVHAGNESVRIRVRVDGAEAETEVTPRDLLSDVLRHQLGATGVHVGCEQGSCGACTITLDGELVRSCLLLAIQAQGREVTTVAALGDEGRLHPLQEAFRAERGLQCGYCTPGILVSLVAAARAGLVAEDAIEEVLPGHLCRCTGYAGIRAAIRSAWPTLTAGRAADPGSGHEWDPS